MLQLGDRVKLLTFNGKQPPPSGAPADKDYWRLIGWHGTIVQSISQPCLVASFSAEPRLLVQFDHSVSALNLHCHNDVPNSLWILESDLVADLKRQRPGSQSMLTIATV